MADDAKTFSALLTGIARRTYYGEKDISNQLLKDGLYPDMDESQFEILLNKSTGVIKSMAAVNMDFNQLEAFLTSQTKKRGDNAITDEQAKVFTKFWKNHKAKIHEHMVSECTWGNRLKNFNCRIDMKNQSRHEDQINVPTAIVELQIGRDTGAGDKVSEIVRFEMDEEKLTSVIKQMETIEQQITEYCQKQV